MVQYFVQVLRCKSSKSTTFKIFAKRGDEEQYTANIWIITYSIRGQLTVCPLKPT